MDKPQRNARTTKAQLELMVNFLTENRIILNFIKENTSDIILFDKKWDELTQVLNSSGCGPIKTKSQWKRVLTEFKCNTRKKFILYKKELERTGGGCNRARALSNIEEKFMALQSKVALEGMEISEIGLPVEENIIIENHAGIEFEEEIELDTDDVVLSPENKNSAENLQENLKKTLPRKIASKKTLKRVRKTKITKLDKTVEEYKKIALAQNEEQNKLIDAIKNLGENIGRKRKLICKPIGFNFF